MNVLITGASGYVGAKLFTDLSGDHDVAGTYHKNNIFEGLHGLDVTDRSSVLQVVSTVKPDIVVHAAANASRSQCREAPKEAIAVNARGTKHIVEAANRLGARVVYISSLGADDLDSFYGETKFVGEDYVRDTDAGYDVLRASMTYGYSPNTVNDRPFNRIVRTIRDGEPVRYDDSWSFQPTYLNNLSESIQHIVERRPRDRRVNVLVPKSRTKFEIASDILAPYDVQVQSTEDRQSGTEPEDRRATPPDFPKCSYEDMIRAIRSELEEHGLVTG